MNKVSIFTLISQATLQTKQISVHLIRAQSNFLAKESLDRALKELKETEKLLEKIRLSYPSTRS
jgi:hypothetical protein